MIESDDPADTYRDATEALLGHRVRPRQRVLHGGHYVCVWCGWEEDFKAGETACDCRYDGDEAQWALKCQC